MSFILFKMKGSIHNLREAWKTNLSSAIAEKSLEMMKVDNQSNFNGWQP